MGIGLLYVDEGWLPVSEFSTDPVKLRAGYSGVAPSIDKRSGGFCN
jgi:hypothetical protein